VSPRLFVVSFIYLLLIRACIVGMLGQVPSDEIGDLFFALRNLHYLKVMNMLIFYEKSSNLLMLIFMWQTEIVLFI